MPLNPELYSSSYNLEDNERMLAYKTGQKFKNFSDRVCDKSGEDIGE